MSDDNRYEYPETFTEEDVRWLAALKQDGHCGESTADTIWRERYNARIDRLVAGLAGKESAG